MLDMVVLEIFHRLRRRNQRIKPPNILLEANGGVDDCVVSAEPERVGQKLGHLLGWIWQVVTHIVKY